jgi:glycosyltransferase involved in cell wall biosynthesis
VNIYFAPRSFGGATIVAEHMVRRLVKDKEALVSVFTTLPDDRVPAYGLQRYEVDGAQVFAMGLPNEIDAVLQFDNPETLTAFKEVLRATMPEVVHIHSIQGIGATIIDACKDVDIPVVVTLHDAWWICGRGFMVNHQGYPCYQEDVDLSICDTCVDDPKLNRLRQRRLHEHLMRADRLLTPSEFFRELYRANGFSEEKITVNRNGVLPPGANFRSTVSNILRFGYIGGRDAVKGFDILCQAFSLLSRRDYKLVVVDSTQSLGFSSLDDWSPDFKSQMSLVPAFDQDGLDDYFSEIDVLLFPTLCKESFGLTVREALIRDVWVVTTAAGGVVEDIEDGVNGTILPIELTPELLRGELERLIEDAKKVKSFVNPHKDQIKTVNGQADELWHIYSECIN